MAWEPGPEDLRRVLDEQNPWHRLGRVPGVMAPPSERALARDLWRCLLRDDPRRFQLVLGPRRVGKTTAMYQTVRRLLEEEIGPTALWWFRLDHPLLLQIPLGRLVDSVRDTLGSDAGRPAFLFLDELVYAKDWDLWLKTFYDERYPVRIVATSSATAALRKRRLESGVGRWDERFLTPYLITEYLDLAGGGVSVTVQDTLAETIHHAVAAPPDLQGFAELRRRFLLTGGFPELLVHTGIEGDDTDEESRLLASQRVLRTDAIERAVYKDIPQSFGVENPLMLERLLYVLAGQVGGVLSPKRICGELEGLSQPTFDKYLSYLERAFLVFALPNYSGRERNVQKRGRKLYFWDGALRNAALQRGLAPASNPDEMGILYENAVAAHLHALALQTQVRLFHWRDGKHEVDLVYDHPRRPLAFEVGSSGRHTRAGLRALAERHPRFEGGVFLVAPDVPPLAPEKTGTGVGTLPLDLFLVVVGRQAEAALAARL